MAGITPDTEPMGIEKLEEFLKKLAGGNEGQKKLLWEGLISTGWAAIEEADNPGLKEMTDLTAATLAKLLLSPDPADRALAAELYGPVYDGIREAKETAATLGKFYRTAESAPGQG